jgi:hypothetical protein
VESRALPRQQGIEQASADDQKPQAAMEGLDMGMTPRKPSPTEMLAAIGTALYGREWKNPRAHALGIDGRQMRRWANEGHELPMGVFDDALKLIDRRRHELGQQGLRLRGYINGHL